MALKDTSGREPIRYIEIKQDFCQFEWGKPPCAAGLTNLIVNSGDLGDSASWDSTRYTFTDGISDPDGGTYAQRLTKIAGAGSVGLITNDAVSGSTTDDLWFYLAVKARSVVADDIEAATINAYTNADGTTRRTQRINITTGALLGASGAFDEFLDMSSTDLGGGWYLFKGRVPAGDYTGVYLLSFGKLDGGFATNGAEVDVYYVQVTYDGNQNYGYTKGLQVDLEGETPCFNTRGTCQDPATYELTTLDLKFVDNRSPIPSDGNYIPSLTNASVSPAQLNPAGANPSQSALGKRATLTASFQDHTHNDYLVDPYVNQRAYDPMERGSFWSKWRARNQYYLNTFIDYVTGYLSGGQVVDKTTRSYVMTSYDGPDSNGGVRVGGKDILTLAEDTKAQAPLASTGKLSAGITDSATSLTLSPVGVGDLEYPTSGKLRINDEVMSFTGRTGDSVTGLTRGLLSTEAEAHNADDTVQLCLEYSSQNYSDILYDLLNVYAGIPAIYLDKVNWDIEQAAYVTGLYSTLITAPVGVSRLIGEMCEQMYFSVWWDERESLVKTRAVRSAEDDNVTELTDDQNIIEDSARWKDQPKELTTQVWIYYGRRNPTINLDQDSNFSAIEVVADFEAESETKHDTAKIKKIRSRWIPAGGTALASVLGTSILERYADIPRSCSFTLDAKDKDLWLGDFIQITNRLNVDEFGEPQPVNLQILQANEPMASDRFTYVAQQYVLQQISKPDEIDFPIGSDLLNVNLRTLYEQSFGAPLGTETILFTLRAGVEIGGDAANYTEENISARSTTNDTYASGSAQIGEVQILQRQGIASPRTTAKDATYTGSSDTAAWIIEEYPITPALTTGTWPVGVTLKLVIEGGASIIGEGGNGSAHAFNEADGSAIGVGYHKTVKAGDGGHALKVEHPIEITNNGLIAQGAGGGACFYTTENGTYLLGGGGGAGNLESKVKTFIDIDTDRRVNAVASAGGLQVGGNGSVGEREPYSTLGGETYNFPTASETGAGGSIDSPDGQRATVELPAQSSYSGTGGTGGDAVESGGNNITWINQGDVRGTING